MPHPVSIESEPVGATYRSLLEFAASLGSLLSLVTRDDLALDDSALRVTQALETDLVEHVRTASWPGTTLLLGGMATVDFYRISPNSLRVLQAAEGLYSWVAPSHPEDLAFYDSERRPWLGSIAHERDAFVYPEAVSLGQLVQSVPGIRLSGEQ